MDDLVAILDYNWDFNETDTAYLRLRKDAIIVPVRSDTEGGWILGMTKHGDEPGFRCGWFPSNYVAERTPQIAVKSFDGDDYGPGYLTFEKGDELFVQLGPWSDGWRFALNVAGGYGWIPPTFTKRLSADE